MTQQTITETVDAMLGQAGLNGYRRQADTVVTALVERERAIADRLVEYAQHRGLSAEEARQVMTEAGMELPDPRTERRAVMAKQIEDLQAQITTLTEEIRNL